MSAHLAMRSGNPALSADTFTSAPRVVGQETMTISGTVNKTAMALAILFVAATYVWGQGTAGVLPFGLIWGGVIGGFVVAIVTVVQADPGRPTRRPSTPRSKGPPWAASRSSSSSSTQASSARRCFSPSGRWGPSSSPTGAA